MREFRSAVIGALVPIALLFALGMASPSSTVVKECLRAGQVVQCDQGAPGNWGAWKSQLQSSTGTNVGVDSSGNMDVTLGTAVAGENIAGTRGAISNWIEVMSAYRAYSLPAVTTTTVAANASACNSPGGASCTVVLAATQIIPYPNFTITVKNTGANALTNVNVEVSPDNSSWQIINGNNGGTLTSGACTALAASGMCYLQYSAHSFNYVRVEAQSASGSSSNVWLTEAM